MDALRPVVVTGDAGAISSFRRIHMRVALLNLVLFCAMIWSTAQISV